MRDIQTLARRILLLPLLLAVTLGGPAVEAEDLRLTTSNDLLSGSDAGDDLYTAAVEITLGSDRGRVTIGERMFTDREQGLRHDETFVEVGRDLPASAGWQPEVRLGLVRLGRGLLGESVQNRVHQWVGSEPVHLSYRESTDWYPTLAASASRELGHGGGFWWSAEADGFAAPEFRSWARFSVAAERQLPGGLALRVGLGARTDRVESDWLRAHVDASGLTGDLALSWQRLTLRWARNADGTGKEHLTLAWRLSGSTARPAGRVR